MVITASIVEIGDLILQIVMSRLLDQDRNILSTWERRFERVLFLAGLT
jgi:hypothetical protein